MSGKKKADQVTPMVCQKNDILTLEIVDMGTEGEGIGKKDGYTLFVKDALIGDVVRICVIKTKKHFGYAKLLEIVTPSPYRREPVCPVARQCGGCQLQHCTYEKQLIWKEEKVQSCLNRIGGFSVCLDRDMTKEEHRRYEQEDSKSIVMEPILSMDTPYHYRNKAQFPVGLDKEGRLVAGFYAGRTHSIIENTDCAIQHPCNHAIVETVLQYMRDYQIAPYDEKNHSGFVRHILTRVGVHTGEVMVCLVINGKALPHSDELVKRLCSLTLKGIDVSDKLDIKSICLNHNEEKTNVILGQKITVLYGEKTIEDSIGDIYYRISPLSFYQVNPLQTKKLYDTALEYAGLKGGEVVWDLYCGIGTISLFLAQKAAKVCGVEIVPQAIEDARENAKRNHMTNVEFFVGAAEDVVPEQYAKSNGTLKADVVMLDPPRKGCDERLLQTVVQMEPEKIVYVSCDPATLARDLRYLCDRGYELKRVRACDMFGMSYHVETVCLLSREKVDGYVNVDLDANKIVSKSKTGTATYKEIKEYINDKYGFTVSSLNIAQVKDKCGLNKRNNYNKGVDGHKVPACPEKKEKALLEAFKHFGLI